jgi:hypothetical protein
VESPPTKRTLPSRKASVALEARRPVHAPEALLLARLPRAIVRHSLAVALRTRFMETAAEKHANSARGGMNELLGGLTLLVLRAGSSTPALERLATRASAERADLQGEWQQKSGRRRIARLSPLDAHPHL